MNVLEAIYTRRSVRKYAEAEVDRATIERLLQAAVQAPTGMNAQPWTFGVIQGTELLRSYSDRAKAALLSKLDQYPPLEKYRGTLEDPAANLFHGAPALVLIYARAAGPLAALDCCLAAENLLLAATEMALGTCWIGLSSILFDSAEMKTELGVPTDYTCVAQLIVGYPDGPTPPVEKNPPQILFWQ